jgi:hypothetical protein
MRPGLPHLILAFFALGPAAAVAASPDRPPRDAAAARTNLIEWALDLHFSPRERKTMDRFNSEDWRKGDRRDAKDALAFWEQIQAATPEQREAMRSAAASALLDTIRSQARSGDAQARWLLKIYDRAHAAARPAPSRAAAAPARSSAAGGVDLEPCRIGTWSLVRPRGWSASQDPDGGIVLQSNAGDGSTGIAIVRRPSTDDAQDAVQREIGRFPGATIDFQDKSGGFRSATVVLSRGAERFAVDVRRISVELDGTVQTTTAGFASEEAFQRAGGQDGFLAIATSVHGAGELAPSNLDGSWSFVTGQAIYNVYRGGVWSGTADAGAYVQFDLVGRKYHLARYQSSTGPMSAWSVTEQWGLAETDGSTTALHPGSCQETGQFGNQPVAKSRCSGGPYALVVEGVQLGKLVLSGLGLRNGIFNSFLSVDFDRARPRR